MTSSGFEDYVKKRYDNQVEWYSKSATKNKKWYRRYQVGNCRAIGRSLQSTVAIGMSDNADAVWHIVSLITSAAVTVFGNSTEGRFASMTIGWSTEPRPKI